MRSIMLSAAVAVASLSISSVALAEEVDGFGLGLQLGDTSGLTGKAWLSSDDAIQMSVGFGPGGAFGDGPVFTADWVHDVVEGSPGSGYVNLAFHAGVGAGLGFARGGCYRDVWGRRFCEDNDFAGVGLRVPLGFDIVFTRAPVELYVELVPGLNVAPVPGRFDMAGATGARFYF